MIPLLLDQVASHKLTIAKLVEITSTRPAEIMNIQEHKGKIQTGYDADLVVADLEKTQLISNDLMYSKCGWTPFAGTKVTGWPVMTMVNGKIVYNHGEFDMTHHGHNILAK